MDSFFDSLQAKILYSFAKAQEHFSLNFDTAKKEGGEKTEEWVKETGEKAAKKLREETEKIVREGVDKKKPSSPAPKAPSSPEKNGRSKENSAPSLPPERR
ncbi:MAG: hypothetical protein J6331_06300 [Lentisphaeria bacterium]|nr:hypothetical protein [Lentisphaeria bacterium]